MLHFECPVCQPNLYCLAVFSADLVVSAKIRLIRISAEKFVQPAEFKKNPAEGSAKVKFSINLRRQVGFCDSQL